MPSVGAPRTAPTQDLTSSMYNLVRYRREHLTGDEKGEAQIFLEHLFQAFGHAGVRQAGAVLEARMRRRSDKRRRTSFADCIWKPRVLIEMKKAGEPLGRHYEQALEYWFRAVPDRPRYVVLCNFDEFWISTSTTRSRSRSTGYGWTTSRAAWKRLRSCFPRKYQRPSGMTWWRSPGRALPGSRQCSTT
jgi:hypothetical protein